MVTSMLPHAEAISGGGLVMYGQLVALCARHEVTLATFAGADPMEREAVDQLRASGVKVHFVWRSWLSGTTLWKRRWRDAVGWLRGGRPLRTLQFYDDRMQTLIHQLIERHNFDLLQVEDNAMANYTYPVQIPTVLTEHEVRAHGPLAYKGGGKDGRIRRALARAEMKRWQQYQTAVWSRFERIQVFTPRDAAVIGEMAPHLAERVRINPFGVEIPAQIRGGQEQDGSVLFVGGFGHPPNVDAALWLGREIMPLLRVRWPGVRLTIVGSYPTKAVQALTGHDIEVMGRVPSITPFLERAAVVLAPLRMGGGMRLKVLQAMAMSKAVVTTRLGAEGLAPTGSRPPLAIAETAEAVADITATLLGDRDYRQSLGRQARDFVSEYHNWSAYGRRLETIYAELR
jgi:glycosyltransferase involved in cell wall biosynthesis